MMVPIQRANKKKRIQITLQHTCTYRTSGCRDCYIEQLVYEVRLAYKAKRKTNG